MVREVIGATSFDQATPDDIVLSRVVITLNHDARGDALEQILSKEWLRLGRSEFADAVLTAFLTADRSMLDELALTCLHAVGHNKAQVVPSGDSLEAHDHLCNLAPPLIVAQLGAPQVLTERVHHDQFDGRLHLNDLL